MDSQQPDEPPDHDEVLLDWLRGQDSVSANLAAQRLREMRALVDHFKDVTGCKCTGVPERPHDEECIIGGLATPLEQQLYDDVVRESHRAIRAEEECERLGGEIERILQELEAATADFPPDSQTIAHESRKLLKLRIKRGRIKIRDAHMRNKELAEQRDAARSERDTYKQALVAQTADLTELLKLVQTCEREGKSIEPGDVRSIMYWVIGAHPDD